MGWRGQDVDVCIYRDNVREYAAKIHGQHPVTRADIEGGRGAGRDRVQHGGMEMEVVVPRSTITRDGSC